ncbi:RUN domain containing protein [Aphelenchoides avenae]|nr:RUN domain containing protein [Aphelenchus avenae]
MAADELDQSKSAIRRELESVVKVAAQKLSLDGSLSNDINQDICNIMEAIFIHGLKDAFFLKGSRHSKYPEPNFWPFVSKFTHRSIQTQIDSQKQIRNEIGKARAWVRIVLNEGALESYINLIAKDFNQLSFFYLPTAFLRDEEKVEALRGYLKALSKIPLKAPTNSSFLNTWTPSPLILAGLIRGKPLRVAQLSTTTSRNASRSSLNEVEAELALNALDMDDTFDSAEMPLLPGILSSKDHYQKDFDDNSSVYSHPSMLDGGLGTKIPIRPSFSPMFGGTPENDPFIASTAEELTAEVVVHRRRTRPRRNSRSSSEGGQGSRNISRSGSESQLPAVDEPAVSAPSISNDTLIEETVSLLSQNPEASNVSAESSEVPSEHADSGIEERTDMDDKVLTALTGAVHDDVTKDPSEHGEAKNAPGIYATSLHDELAAIATATKPGTVVTSSNWLPSSSNNSPVTSIPSSMSATNFVEYSSPPSTSGNSLYGKGWTIPVRKDTTESRSSFSSSLGTDHSGPVMTLDSALRNVLRPSGTRSSYSADSESTSVPETATIHPLMDVEADSAEGTDSTVTLLSRTADMEEAELQKEEPVVIEEERLEVTDKYGIPTKTLALLTQIPVERGLDAQNFFCPSCKKSIGGSFSSFKLCNLDAQYYCEECWKRGDESIIPARVILNWDTRPRPIAKPSRAILKSQADRPFLRIDEINPRLYEHSRQMAKIKQLRKKLSLVAMYLLSCKQSVADDLQRRLSPHDYLYKEIHLYSIVDLENAISGVLERRLNSVINFAINHVHSCALCLQKGFICELCSSKRVIYPFQIDIVFRCKKCFSVYHRKCMESSKDCPKCVRRAKYAMMAEEIG